MLDRASRAVGGDWNEMEDETDLKMKRLLEEIYSNNTSTPSIINTQENVDLREGERDMESASILMGRRYEDEEIQGGEVDMGEDEDEVTNDEKKFKELQERWLLANHETKGIF